MNFFKIIFYLAGLVTGAGSARANWNSELMYAPHALERSPLASPADAPVRTLRVMAVPWTRSMLDDFLETYEKDYPGRLRALGFRTPVRGCQLVHRCFFVLPVVKDPAHCLQAQRAQSRQRLIFEFSPPVVAFTREAGRTIMQSALIHIGSLIGLAMPDVGDWEAQRRQTPVNGYFIELPKGFLVNPEDLCRN
jgi:hypothetical protein